MTTQIPTSNSTEALTSTTASNELIDVAVLTKLANEFFSAMPEGFPATGFSPQSLAVAAGSVLNARQLPGAQLGIPEAYAAALPQVSTIPSADSIPGHAALPVDEKKSPVGTPPSTPYYFLGESSSYPSTAALQTPPVREDRVTAQSFGLPGQDALKQLLSVPSQKIAASPETGNSSHFYFSDFQNPSLEPQQAKIYSGARPPFDVNAIRRDFPILSERVNGRPLIWFDNAATTQKPQSVIDRLSYFYQHENSNIHRAAHELAARSTDAYEGARNKVARFLGASSVNEIVFVRGATEAINLVAKSWGSHNIAEGDEIIVSHLEHHANIVPWQQLTAEKGAKLKVIPVDNDGQILLDEYQKLLSKRTRLVSITQVSNALGTITPVKEIIDLAHRAGALVLVDGAQAVSHMQVNVQALDADFYVLSGHKLFGPTGIGVLYGKEDILNAMPPWQGGGNMISDVTFEKTLYHAAPARFEAGTGNIADAVGLGAAIDYIERIGMENISQYEHGLLVYATQGLQSIPGLRLIGTAKEKASVLSFVLEGFKTEEVGAALNREGIAVRSGHHCAQPILRRFGLEATVRPSLAFYNTCEEVDALVSVVKQLANSRHIKK